MSNFEITPRLKMTSDQLYQRLNDLYSPVTGQDRRDLETLITLVARAEIPQSQSKAVLLNPRAAGRSPEWLQVHQLIEDLSFQSVSPDLRDQIAEIEQKLTESGVIQ